jgi:hypothetical protein
MLALFDRYECAFPQERAAVGRAVEIAAKAVKLN